jgi:gas vesicle protein
MSSSGSKVFLAAVFGLAAGIGIGLLVAPAKGSKTRKKLKKMIRHGADLLHDDISEKISTLQSAFSDKETAETAEKTVENE